MNPTLLVIGAQYRSLGWRVAERASEQGYQVTTAGITGEEYQLDVRNLMPSASRSLLDADHVVCTVGINSPSETELLHYEVNVLGPLRCLDTWLRYGGTGHFVIISSNSAHIARSGSRAYCGSKAALSMAIRCTARDVAKDHHEFMSEERMPAIYGYEPGWLGGTPMSNAVEDSLEPGAKLHRIPSGQHLSPHDLATVIVSNLQIGNNLMNGALLRLDGGDQ